MVTARRSLTDSGTRRLWPKPCKFCGAPIRWGMHDGRWMPLDAAEDLAGAWARDGGRIVEPFRAWPGANWTRHNRHVCPEVPRG